MTEYRNFERDFNYYYNVTCINEHANFFLQPVNVKATLTRHGSANLCASHALVSRLYIRSTRRANTESHHKILTTHFFTHWHCGWSFHLKKKTQRKTSLIRRNYWYIYLQWIAIGQLVVSLSILSHAIENFSKKKEINYILHEKNKINSVVLHLAKL